MRACLWLVILTACGGTAAPTMPPTPPRQTTGVIAGGLCNGDKCTCKPANAEGDGGVGVPAGAEKRFEIRLTSAQELWAKVGGTAMYKSREQTEACFYVDLTSGDTPVEVRSSDKVGASVDFTIRELGTKTKSWYDTFHFNCGHPGACSYDELDAFKKDYTANIHHVADVCGSTKIKGLTWNAQHAPDAEHPGDLLVSLVLDVYKRAPEFAHGDPNCAHQGKGKAAAPDAAPAE
jgi:hypothetical protein